MGIGIGGIGEGCYCVRGEERGEIGLKNKGGLKTGEKRVGK